MTAPKTGGCYDYRTVVEMYLVNDTGGTITIEIPDVGSVSVGAQTTQKVIDQKSSSQRLCT